jgi:hypothetical protein
MSDDTRLGGVVEAGGGGTPRPKMVSVLIMALAFQGLSGVAGGFGLIFDPSGALIGLPAEWLAGSPFDDYAIPGLVLLTLLGLAPLAVAHGVWRRRRWSWVGSLLVAAALLVWLAVEIAVIGYHTQPPLQLIYGVVGMLILGATLMRSVRAHLVGDEFRG